MAKTPKMARKVSPQQAEEQLLADQVMAMMGEDANAVAKPSKYPNKQLGTTPKSSNALERGTAPLDAEMEGSDSYYRGQTLNTLAELGDAAYEMETPELLQSLGMTADPVIVGAFDKLTPEERIAILQSTAGEPATTDDVANMAKETVARRPMSTQDRGMMDDVQGELLKTLGVQ